MKTRHYIFYCLLLCFLVGFKLQAQTNIYTERFKTMYQKIKDPNNGYFSKDGAPYHSIETLMVEAPDHGHESTSEAYSFWIWLEAMNGKVSGDWTSLNSAWNTLEKQIIPTHAMQPSNDNYVLKGGKATYAAEHALPSGYPSPLESGVPVGTEPVSKELHNAYGTSDVYGMHWLLDCDNFYGYGNLGDGVSTPSYINTFQRGKQESTWETVPHPSVEYFKWGGPNGFIDLFVKDSGTPAKQWRYTNAPDADARAVQAIYWAAEWAKAQGKPASTVPVDKAAKMGDYLRLAMFDKYYKKIGAQDKFSTGGTGYESCHYLMSWYYSWGGPMDASQGWAWRIGSSHNHFGYQNPVAAYVLANSTDLVPKSVNGKSDWQKSLKRQVEFYRWLQSAEGAISGGATNSWNGVYDKYPAGTSTFYGMAYEANPVYEDPGSNTWFGFQAWSVERLAEYYYLSNDPMAKIVMDKWVKWVKTEIHLFPDGTYEIPVDISWTGQPDTWVPASPGANSNLHVQVLKYNQDIGITACLAKALIYYAAATKKYAVLDDEARMKAKEILDRMWTLYYEPTGAGVATIEVRGDYKRFFEQEIYIPTGWSGTMANGDLIKPGVKFIDIRSKYKSDPEFARLKAAYDAKQDFQIKYHRFWAQADVALANAEYGIFFESSGKKYTITPSSGINGKISPSTAVTVDEGNNASFTFEPNSGYEIDKVTVDGVTVTNPSNPYVFVKVTANHSISVSFKQSTNRNPVASFTATPLSGNAPLTVSFNATASSDPDRDSISFAWNFGDNTTGTGVTPSHVYQNAGNYTVSLVVTDSKGAKSIPATISISAIGQGQQYYGNLPSTLTQADALAAYNRFKANYFTSCGNNIRVKWDNPDQTVSEGIGYGMLLAVYADDRTSFDGLYNYYKAFLNEHGLMHWRINGCSSVADQNGATDAEIDVAMSLIVADKKWGNTGAVKYNTEAAALISKIKQWEVEAGTYVLKPGDMWGGSDNTNISYFSPAYFKEFGKYTNDQNFWNAVATKCYDIINNNLSRNNAKGGLVSDWCKADGTQVSGRALEYRYDACRTPWRISFDYYWNGDINAKAYLDKVNYFLSNDIGGIKNVKDGYAMNGTVLGQYHNMTFVGTFACAGIAATQAIVDTYGSEVKSLGSYSYFDAAFDALSKFMLTGLIKKPGSSVEQFSITANSTGNGSITPNGTWKVDKGASTTININPNAGYKLDRLTDNNVVKTITGNRYTISNILENHTVSVSFVIDNNGSTNLALNKPAFASSVESSSFPASKAVDGIVGSDSRWASILNGTSPEWMYVNLGSKYTINRVVIKWEAASAKDYRVEISDDATNWTTIVSKTGMASGQRTDDLSVAATAQYVRIYGTAKTNPSWGYSIFELEVYGGNPQKLAPIANAGADQTILTTANSATVKLNGTASSDPDGTIVSYVWTGNGINTTGATPTISLPLGAHEISLTVTDNDGLKATDKVIITVQQSSCNLLTRFAVPRNTALPDLSNSYDYAFVLGNSSFNTANMSNFTINWSLTYNGLWQYSMNLRSAPWWVDIKAYMNQTFNGTSPACTITGSGIPGLDGNYFVTMDGANFVMIEKTGTYALYFSKTNTPPSGCSSTFKKAYLANSAESSEENELEIFPNMLNSSERLNIRISGTINQASVKIMDLNGRILIDQVLTENLSAISLSQHIVSKGMYVVKVFNENSVNTYKIVVK